MDTYITNNQLTQTTIASSCANVTAQTTYWFISIVCIKFREKCITFTFKFTVTVVNHAILNISLIKFFVRIVQQSMSNFPIATSSSSLPYVGFHISMWHPVTYPEDIQANPNATVVTIILSFPSNCVDYFTIFPLTSGVVHAVNISISLN